MAFTSHGHHISGTLLNEEERPTSVARCGGPGLCVVCTREAGQKLRRDLTIPWPVMLPDEAPVTKAGLKSAFQEILTPMQEGAALTGEMSEELRTLLAVMRTVYSVMPEDKE